MILPGMPRMVGRKKGVPIIDLPPMTSDSTPAGHSVAASSAFDASWAAWRAFDGVNFDTGGWLSTTVPAPWWLRRSASEKFQVVRYAISSSTQPTAAVRFPTDFELQGSLDGTSWLTLDQRSGISWAASQRQEFAVAAPGAYFHYRLYITANAFGNNCRVAELELLQE